jgi:hypothetical protein
VAEDLLSVYYLVGATAGIVSIILALMNWRKDRPVIEPVVLRCTHSAGPPPRLEVDFEVQNTGLRPTTLNEVQATVVDGSAELHGELQVLYDSSDLTKIKHGYDPEDGPKTFAVLPMPIGGGFTERLHAIVTLSQNITHREAKCILTVRYTHGVKSVESRSRSTPLHEASLPG